MSSVREKFWQNSGRAVIADGDHHLLLPRLQAEIQRRVGRGKLGRIFQQVINDLRNEVTLACDQHGVLGDLRLHIEAAVIDLLLHAQQCQTHTLADVEALLLQFLALQLGDVQHTAHKAAEAACFIGDNAEIMLLPLGRDRAIEDTVGIACDGGHGGFQLMGHIGDKVAALPLRLCQGVCHGVKGLRQLAHLIGAVQLGDTHIEIAVGIGAGGPHHVGDGLDLPHGGKGADGKGDQQNGGENNDGGEENNGGTTYDWPSDISSIKWTGSGNVVGITELTASQHGEVWIYVDAATLDEVGAYIEMLKGNGVSYWGEGDEPALAFENGEYNWAGDSGSIKIKLLEEPDTVAAVDGTYQLEIDIYADLF